MANKSYKGKYKPKNPEKYKGNADDIVWRSTWERSIMRWLDYNPDVLYWNSEETVIPYVSPVDGRAHRYYIDMTVAFKNGTNLLIEVKPKYQTMPPDIKKVKKSKKSQERLLLEAQTYAVNDAKWKAAEKWANQRGFKFVIFTEDTLRDMGIHINKGSKYISKNP